MDICPKSISNGAYIHIKIQLEGDWLYFEVENNFEVIQANDSKAHGIGLKNARKRLSYLYEKDEYHLEIIKKENIFKVQLRLQLKTTR